MSYTTTGGMRINTGTDDVGSRGVRFTETPIRCVPRAFSSEGACLSSREVDDLLVGEDSDDGTREAPPTNYSSRLFGCMMDYARHSLGWINARHQLGGDNETIALASIACLLLLGFSVSPSRHRGRHPEQ